MRLPEGRNPEQISVAVHVENINAVILGKVKPIIDVFAKKFAYPQTKLLFVG
ncbi:MAG: hypothetical protein OHK0045_13880 [Raineya sp.]